jgi:hypothetical protein
MSIKYFGLASTTGLLISLAQACGGGGETDADADLVQEPDSLDPAVDTDAVEDPPAEAADGDLPVEPPADVADAGEDTEEEDGAANPCPRLPGPEDTDRKVVVSHPYDASAGASGIFEVLDLSAAGSLTRPGVTFEMSRSGGGEIAFTPDGEVGIAVHDDGTLGVFRIDASGIPEVIHASFSGAFYASRVVMDPSGERAWVLDSEWRAPDGSGGIYSVRIGCDGSLAEEGLIAPAKLPYTLNFLPGDPGSVVVAARDILDEAEGPDVYLLRWSLAPEVMLGTDVFPDNGQIVSSAAVTADARYVVIADNNMFTPPNRVAAVEILDGGLRAAQILTAINDPVAAVASPWTTPILVVSGFDDALFVLDYDPSSASSPLTGAREMGYSGASPQLPGTAVMIDRGSLRGRVLVTEVSGVRQVQFAADGSIADLGLTDFGSGYENMPGSIGVQP